MNNDYEIVVQVDSILNVVSNTDMVSTPPSFTFLSIGDMESSKLDCLYGLSTTDFTLTEE